MSAIRIMDFLTVGMPNSPAWNARFFALTRLHTPIRGDIRTHLLRVAAIGPNDDEVAFAAPKEFTFGYAIDPSAPGGYSLSTEFNINPSVGAAPLGTYEIRATMDGEIVARAALTLRKR